MQDQGSDQIPFWKEHSPDDPRPDAPFSIRQVQSICEQFDRRNQDEYQSDENLHDKVSRGDRQPASSASSSQHEPSKHRRVVDQAQRTIAVGAMRASRDNRLALGSSACNNVDEATDARTEIKEPPDQPVFQGPAGKPHPKGNLRIPRVDLPPRCNDPVPDLDRRKDHRVKNPASKYRGEQEHQGPISAKRNQAFTTRWKTRWKGIIRRRIQGGIRFDQNAPRLLCNCSRSSLSGSFGAACEELRL